MNEDTIEFHGAEVNLAEEYHEARKMMGQKSTDLELLYEKVTLLYLNTNDKWQRPYFFLLNEIEDRQAILAQLTTPSY